MLNLDKVKEALSKDRPREAERINSSDAYRIMNCWMQNEENRERAARAMRVASKCAMCVKDGQCGFDGNGWLCRQGMLEWLNLEASE